MDEYERELAILNLVPQNNQYVLSVYDHGESYEGMPPITFKSAENKVTTNQLYCFIVMEQITILGKSVTLLELCNKAIGKRRRFS
jgi:hypothetical protein